MVRRNEQCSGLHGKCIVRSSHVLAVYGNGLNARPARPRAERPLDSRHCFGFPFDMGFDATVCQVAHPTCGAFAQCPILNEVPEANALDTTADYEPPRHQHEEDGIISSPVSSPGQLISQTWD
jgi:hypothetical protein